MSEKEEDMKKIEDEDEFNDEIIKYNYDEIRSDAQIYERPSSIQSFSNNIIHTNIDRNIEE